MPSTKRSEHVGTGLVLDWTGLKDKGRFFHSSKYLDHPHSIALRQEWG